MQIDRKVIAKLEVDRRQRLYKKYPSHATKLRYNAARINVGLSPNAVGSIDWSRINKRTTFIWKFPTLLECGRWAIEQTFAGFAKHPNTDRVQIALHYIKVAFGVMPSDILGDQKSPTLHYPRMIAMVCVKRSGIGRNDCMRRFNRDHTSYPIAERKVGYLFEGIDQNGPRESALPLGPASDGQPEGSISP